MSWELLPLRARTETNTWSISVGRNGVTVWIPADHPLAKADYVTTQIGKKENAGWIRLIAAKSGRTVMKSKNIGARPQVRYSTLPGAPEQLSIVEVETRPNADPMTVAIRLPWGVPDVKVLTALTTPSKPPVAAAKVRPAPQIQEDEAEAVERFIRERGVSLAASTEQVAQFLRESGYRVVVRTSTNGKTYAPGGAAPVVDGETVTVKRMYELANEVRTKGGLQPYAVPA